MYRFLAALLFVLCPSLIHAAAGVPLYRPVENIHTDIYQGGSKIWAIEQGEEGVLFFAAGSTLCIWTGARWNSYPTQSVLRALDYDAETRRVYCAGDNFFGYWAVNKYGDFELQRLYHNDDRLHGQIFWRIIHRGELLYLQTHEALYCYDLQTDEFTPILENVQIAYLYQSDDEIYLQSDNKLLSVSGKQTFPTSITCSDRIVDVARQGDEWMLVTETRGILRYRDGVLTEAFPALNRTLSDMRIFSAQCLDNGSYVLGTILGGAYIVSPEGEVIHHFNEASGLETSTVLSVNATPGGDIWLGLDGGIARVDIHSAEWLYRSIDKHIGDVYTAALWHNALYLGTNKGLFVVREGTPAQLVEGLQGQVWHLEQAGDVLMIVHDQGLFSMQPNGQYRLEQPGIWKFRRWQSEPNLYTASDRDGVLFFELKEGKPRLRNRLKGYENYWSISARDDRFGALWVDELLGSVQRVMLDANKEEVAFKRSYQVGDPHELVYANYLDNALVFTQNKDCYIYDFDRDTIKQSDYYTRLASSFSGPRLSLLQSGNLFFNFNGSDVEVIERKADQFVRRPDLFHGIPSTEFSDQYSQLHQLNDTLVAIGCANGLAVYDVKAAAVNPHNRISLGKCTYNLLGKRYSTELSESDGAGIAIPYGATNIELEFWGIPYPSILRSQLDREPYQPLPNNAVMQIPYLKGGAHTLTLTDYEANELCKVELSVRHHWSRSGWFIVGTLALIVLIGWGANRLYKRRVAHLRQRYDAQRQAMVERERIKYENEMLSMELRERNKKLTSMAINDININNILKEISAELNRSAAASQQTAEQVRPAQRIIDKHMRNNGSWKVFKSYFNGIYDGFFDRLRSRYPQLTNNDLKICAYIRLGMSTKEIATMMNIEIASAESARYRLRKNMGLAGSESLTELISKI